MEYRKILSIVLSIIVFYGCATTLKHSDPNFSKSVWEKFVEDARSGKIDKVRNHLHGEVLEDFNQQLAVYGSEHMSNTIYETYNAEFQIISEEKGTSDVLKLRVLRKYKNITTFQDVVFKNIDGKWKLTD